MTSGRLPIQRSAPILVAILAVAYVAIYMANLSHLIAAGPDGGHNAILARNLARGDGYAIHMIEYHVGTFTSVTHVPEMHGLLQPILLAGLYVALSPEATWLPLPGLVFGALTGVLAFLYGRRIFGESAGLLACALVLSDPDLVYYAWAGVDDTGFACLVLATLMATDRAAEGDDARAWVLAGVLGGLALTQKAAGIILPARRPRSVRGSPMQRCCAGGCCSAPP